MESSETLTPSEISFSETESVANEPLPTFDERFSMAVHDCSDLPLEIRQMMIKYAVEDGLRQLRNGEGRPFDLQEILDELDAESCPSAS